jgi:type II secretory ATPase GspE/PulE/Tfp pilus assembly ATPase PilB-like protein
VNHIQVNRTTGLTFAAGLRSILRQDPDIILVGEIRDDETAQISVNAALTGHLLFSTIHANDAPGTLPRLLNMDVDPFLVASTLELIIAQRLARKICPSCVYAYTTTLTELEHKYGEKFGRFFESEQLTLYRGKGCGRCNYSGYKGRTGVFQLIEMSEELRELIMKNPTGDEIRRLSRREGSKSMFEDGVEKVKLGTTTLEEVLRVAAIPEEES